MPDLEKLPEEMRRPPRLYNPDDYVTTKQFIDHFYNEALRENEERVAKGLPPKKVTRLSRTTVHKAIEDRDRRRINGAFYYDGRWYIHRSNLLYFKPFERVESGSMGGKTRWAKHFAELGQTAKALVTPRKKAPATPTPPLLDEHGQPIKRGRGRPRKNPLPETTLSMIQEGVGQPSINLDREEDKVTA